MPLYDRRPRPAWKRRRATVVLAGLAVLTALSGCAASSSPARGGASSVAGMGSASAAGSPAGQRGEPPAHLDPSDIYSGHEPDLSRYDRTQLRVVVVTGDFLPVRLVNHSLQRTQGFAGILEPSQQLLQSGDLTWVNVEAPLFASCPDITTGFTLCGDARLIEPLAGATHLLVANLASNHITNYGQQGLAETEQRLQAAGAVYSGQGSVAVRDVRGVRFAFIGLNGIGPHIDRAELQREIAQARTMADVVLVQIHWGKEYETYPLPSPGLAPDDPKELGPLVLDQGADVMIGNHPHCVQGSELHAGKLVAFAHGNFVFDQNWSVGTQEGVVGRYYFYGKRLVGATYVPVRINASWQPVPLDAGGGEGRHILDRMVRSSKEIAGLQPAHRPDLSDGNNACT